MSLQKISGYKFMQNLNKFYAYSMVISLILAEFESEYLSFLSSKVGKNKRVSYFSAVNKE
ncbi:MAG: hypothetical protein A2Y94_02425 [Caldithrix sp. RBG_13_44_9]|nr:MAG: hypothetical protein A2Y94_02425 [Caldithrix sp. RBG_13_44_9]